MKKCLACGCECADTYHVCPRCGIYFSDNGDVDYSDNQVNIQVNDNAPQKSTFSNQIPHNEGNTLFNSLWILISFIPFISGFGIIYAGKKTSKKSWICEGVLYELPVIFHLISGSSALTFGLVFLSVIISIIRSLMIITKYNTILNVGSYKKLDHKFLSLLLFISALIPFLNGVAFIYYGNKYSRLYFVEGVIFEMLWVIEIFSFSLIPISFYTICMIIGVAMSSLIVSGMCMISFNFDCDEFYHHVNDNTIKLDKNERKYLEERDEYYKNQLDDLRDVFDAKEKKVRDLISKRFGVGNITSNRFLAVVENSHDNVYKQYNSGYDLINYTSEPSQQVEEELKERITYIKSINDEMEKLTVELILNMQDDKSDDNLDNLVNDMEDLIGDIDKYE